MIESLHAAAGEGAILTADADTSSYLGDWRGRYAGRALAVVRPGTVEQLASVVTLCAQRGIGIVPQGGNTGLVGGGTPLADGNEIVLSLSRLNRIRDLDVANDTITVEAGCVLQAVQEAADRAGRLFPLSLASQGSCEIGGNLSTNAGGVHVVRYGNMRDLVLGLEVVLPDGRIWNGLRGLRKDNTGYDLKQLFIGAEGTLGVITAAVLKLFPQPRTRVVAWLAVETPQRAVDVLTDMRSRFGERVCAFELIGRPALELVLRHIPGSRDPLSQISPWYVLVELSDTLEDFDLGGALEISFGALMEAGAVQDVVIAQSRAQAAELWAMRENISEAQKIEGISIKHDISVPVSRVPRLVANAEAAVRAAFPDLRIVVFGHLGDGNLHYNLSKSDAVSNAEFIAQTPAVNRIVHDLANDLGGSISAEHGLGQLKREEIRRYKSALELELMQRIRGVIDPAGTMNRGKLI